MKFDKQLGNLIIDYYGSILNKHQQVILDMYFKDDLSMSEIAENEGVSKAAISDIINRSYNQLIEYENKLHLVKKSELIDKQITKLEMLNDNKLDKIIKDLKKINRG